jgi:hypothetical protein
MINSLYLAQSENQNDQIDDFLEKLSGTASQDHQQTTVDEVSRLSTINKVEKKKKLDLEAKIAELEAQIEQQKALKAIKLEVLEEKIVVEIMPEVLEIKQEPVEELDVEPVVDMRRYDFITPPDVIALYKRKPAKTVSKENSDPTLSTSKARRGRSKK